MVANATPNTALTTVYHPSGFRVSIAFDESATPETFAALASKIDMIAAAGFLTEAPGLESGEEYTNECASIMRRTQVNKDGSETPVIDFYPEWNAAGTFGRYHEGSVYLDTSDDVKAFESETGLQLNRVPVYDGQSPMKRTHGRPHNKEIKLPKIVKLVKQPRGKKMIKLDDGTEVEKQTWRYVLKSMIQDAPQTPANVITPDFGGNGQQDDPPPPPPANGNGKQLRTVQRHVAYVVTESNSKYTRHKFFTKEDSQIGEPLYTRDLFVTAGWISREDGDWENPGKYPQSEPIPVTASEREDGTWIITAVENNPWVKMFDDGALEKWEAEQKDPAKKA